MKRKNNEQETGETGVKEQNGNPRRNWITAHAVIRRKRRFYLEHIDKSELQ